MKELHSPIFTDYDEAFEHTLKKLKNTMEKKMKETNLTVLPVQKAVPIQVRRKLEMSDDEYKVFIDTYCAGASDAEVKMFRVVCEVSGLNPLLKQIYLVPRWNSKLNKNIFSPLTSIDGLRYIAQRSSEYEGQTLPIFCGPDGVWTDTWLKKEPPFLCRVGVYRNKFREALFAQAKFSSYAVLKKDGNPAEMWNKMSEHMLAKCAEALALRKAFPAEMCGLYTAEEMTQAPTAPGGFDLSDEKHVAGMHKLLDKKDVSDEEVRRKIICLMQGRHSSEFDVVADFIIDQEIPFA